MDPQAFLLPLCIGLTLAGLVAAFITWRAGWRRGKLIQMIGLSILPVGLYLSGLLLIAWNFGVDIVEWAAALIFTPMVWAGLIFIGLAVVLWIIGGFVARRSASRGKDPESAAASGRPNKQVTKKGGPAPKTGEKSPRQKSASDPELDEIEELLRSRGIE